MLDNIENNTIIICPNEYKIHILNGINKLINVKFITIEELLKKYVFDYDYNTILYIMKKYNVKYEIALEYIKNLYYIEDKSYANEKLDFLVDLKDNLIRENLLIFDSKFKEYIKNKKILVYKYNLNKFYRHIFKNLNLSVVEEGNKKHLPVIYEFNSEDEEIEFVSNKISTLLNSGISTDKIKLTNVSTNYINVINKVFKFYDLKIDKTKNIPIISNIVGSTFYNNLDLGLENAIKSIEIYESTKTYNKIIDILNKYVMVDNITDLKTVIEYELNHNYIEREKYTNEIEVVDYKTYHFSDQYVFMIGFNEGIIPITYKDQDYINDSIKPDYLDNTIEKNKDEKKIVLDSIYRIENLIITYKLRNSFNIFYPSNLIGNIGVEVKQGKLNLMDSYSEISNKLKLGMCLDKLIKYGEKSEDLNLLYSNYNISYNTYSHEFTGIDKINITNYINGLKNFNLSYSTMDNYNRCNFRFYVNKILNIKDNIEKFSVELGNIYHYVLESAFKKDINIREYVYKYINDKDMTLTNSNKFFIEKTIRNLEYLINIINKQNTYSNLDNIETEKYIEIPIKDNINFIGFIDKIVSKNIDDETISAIIDYKTYVKKPSLKYIENGIGLQLPTYMYLAKNAYKNIKFAGFYLQNIILDNKSDKEKEDSLKLIGYSNKDKNVLKEFDSNYMSSSVISGMKINNDGSFNSNSLKYMLDEEDINLIIKLTKKSIDNTIKNIMDAKFNINPKYDKINIGCEFCPYKDICYMKEYDFINIKSTDKFGGDEDE